MSERARTELGDLQRDGLGISGPHEAERIAREQPIDGIRVRVVVERGGAHGRIPSEGASDGQNTQ